MYKKGYNAYGIEIVNIIWDWGIKYVDGHWRLIFPLYYVKVNFKKPFIYLTLTSYQLSTFINNRKYRNKQIIQFIEELKIKLMLD